MIMNDRIKYYILKTALSAVLIISAGGPSLAARYGGEFLQIGVGGRAMSMGGAFAAIADDGSAFYWNPAGCARLYKMQFSGMYAPLYGGFGSSLADYHHLGFTMPFAGSTIGINWIRLTVPDIPRFPDFTGLDYNSRMNLILNSNGSPSGYFSDIEEAFFISFARMNIFKLDFGWQYFILPIEIPMGVNFKIIRQTLGEYSSFGMGVDGGIQFKFSLAELLNVKELGYFSLGMNYQDLTRTGVDWGDNGVDAIPPNLKWGMSIDQDLPWINGVAVLAFDQDQRWGGENHFGAEFIFHKVLALRTGYQYHGWTVGAGGKYKSFALDYAFLNTDLGAVNRISASYFLP